MKIEKLEDIKKEYLQLREKIYNPINFDPHKIGILTKKYNKLEKIVRVYDRYIAKTKELSDVIVLIRDEDDHDLKQLALDEKEILQKKIKSLESEITDLTTEEDRYNSISSVIIELRAGTGGDEAALFVGDLFKMYSKYAELNGWKLEILVFNATSIGGYKEMILSLDGDGVYKHLRYESGVHRVQRVPATESSGRLHTSAASVAVLPEADDVDVSIDSNELKIDVFHSSGHGGQSVNTTDSAVRITHLPTGIVVSCQDERSQLKNKAKAMRILRARLFDKRKSEQEAKIAKDRKAQIGSGDRSEKIRTYNFPQNRVTDHRIKFSLYKLQDVLNGDMDELIKKVLLFFCGK